MDEKTKKSQSKHDKNPLNHINKTNNSIKNTKQIYDRIACVFQGGGAIGAYQVGAFQAIYEKGYHPNFLAGVSIGAINSAIIVGNPRSQQIDKLNQFWDTITPKIWTDIFYNEEAPDYWHHFHNQLGALHSLFCGLDGFFKPRALPPNPMTKDTPDKLSYYDTSYLKTTLENLIDFDRINSKEITLCLGSVNLSSGVMQFFNNQTTTITAEHIMASGALPPGFPAIKIGDDYYWDGGTYGNTPLVSVLDALPELNTLCFVVDCFHLESRLPETMEEIEERQKDIRYASHLRRLINVYTNQINLQAAIQFLGEKLSPKEKKDPKVQKILALGQCKRVSIVNIIYSGTPFAHSFKDYNFVRSAVNYRMKMGYENTMEILKKPHWEKKSKKAFGCTIYGVPYDPAPKKRTPY